MALASGELTLLETLTLQPEITATATGVQAVSSGSSLHYLLRNGSEQSQYRIDPVSGLGAHVGGAHLHGGARAAGFCG